MSGLFRTALTVVIFFLLNGPGTAQENYSATSQVEACGSITNAQPGNGVAYRGTVRNSEYGLSMQIPSGQTGWGAAPEAPFHGFAIFLPDQSRACIIFEIHLRIDTDTSKRVSSARTAKRIRLGNRSGWEERATRVIDGVEWTNVTVRFSMHHLRSASDIDDGSITLVTQTQNIARYTPVFEEFLSHLRFEGKELINSDFDARAVGNDPQCPASITTAPDTMTLPADSFPKTPSVLTVT